MVIAEMRGILDNQGHSPFWEAIGHHFFDISLPKADYLSMVNKRFIADLMPKHPIYIPLLPKNAQDVIGAVHQHTKPALRILEDEGFETCDMVDIFEAGPVVRCALPEIRAIRQSHKAPVQAILPAPADSPTYLISNCKPEFRAARGPLAIDDQGRPTLSADLANALQIQPGDTIRYVPLRAAHKVHRDHDANVSFD
jgi:arginine N-succinyltransferase